MRFRMFPYNPIIRRTHADVLDMLAIETTGGEETRQGQRQLVVHQQLHAAIRMGWLVWMAA